MSALSSLSSITSIPSSINQTSMITNDELIQQLGGFGRTEWLRYLQVDVGENPPLPQDIYQIMKAPCPFTRGKRVRDTHMLLLIPEITGNDPFVLDFFNRFLKPDQYDKTGAFKTTPIGQRSHWVLIAMNVIEDSLGKTPAQQWQLMSDCEMEAGLDDETYDAPDAIEAVTCAIMKFLSSNNTIRLFGQHPWLMTLCNEQYQNRQIVVGGYGDDGLRVNDGYKEREASDGSGNMAVGLAPVRRFTEQRRHRLVHPETLASLGNRSISEERAFYVTVDGFPEMVNPIALHFQTQPKSLLSLLSSTWGTASWWDKVDQSRKVFKLIKAPETNPDKTIYKVTTTANVIYTFRFLNRWINTILLRPIFNTIASRLRSEYVDLPSTDEVQAHFNNLKTFFADEEEEKKGSELTPPRDIGVIADNEELILEDERVFVEYVQQQGGDYEMSDDLIVYQIKSKSCRWNPTSVNSWGCLSFRTLSYGYEKSIDLSKEPTVNNDRTTYDIESTNGSKHRFLLITRTIYDSLRERLRLPPIDQNDSIQTDMKKWLAYPLHYNLKHG